MVTAPPGVRQASQRSDDNRRMATQAHHRAAPTERLKGNEWRALRILLPYLLEYKWRVAAALACLIAAKLANVAVPLIMKEVVDGLDPRTAIVAVPVALLAIYGSLRFSTTLFAELREDRKSTRLNSSHLVISYAVFCLKKKKQRLST